MIKLRDLGLSYEQAMHGIQTAVLHEMNLHESREVGGTNIPIPSTQRSAIRTSDTHPNGPKHLRVGLNMSKCDHAALASLLIEKGIIAEEDYLEWLRLFVNEELARYEDVHPRVIFR